MPSSIIMANPYFEVEKMKEFKDTGINQKKVVKNLGYQVGRSNLPVDKSRTALAPGKRISKNGKVYWETRKNRSDMPGTRV